MHIPTIGLYLGPMHSETIKNKKLLSKFLSNITVPNIKAESNLPFDPNANKNLEIVKCIIESENADDIPARISMMVEIQSKGKRPKRSDK